MNRRDIIDIIRRIISLESEGSIDSLAEVERLSLEAISDLNASGLQIEDDLYHFLDDFDIRSKDGRYQKYQTERVVELLD